MAETFDPKTIAKIYTLIRRAEYILEKAKRTTTFKEVPDKETEDLLKLIEHTKVYKASIENDPFYYHMFKRKDAYWKQANGIEYTYNGILDQVVPVVCLPYALAESLGLGWETLLHEEERRVHSTHKNQHIVSVCNVIEIMREKFVPVDKKDFRAELLNKLMVDKF